MSEKTIFLETFGDSPILKVLDFLIVHDDFDYSMTDISHYSQVGYSTLKLFWKSLVDKKIVVQTRIVGKAKLYTLSKTNPVVKKFKDLYWETTKKGVRKKVVSL
ncbi:MAG: hypothetical protein ACI8Y7_000681 [Candidatus Woesearchaeota archaeon]|jgi:hypothetical protein